MTFDLVYKQFGEYSILIEWPSKISEEILLDVISYRDKIAKNHIEQIVNINHAYNSILISYKENHFDYNQCIVALKKVYIKKGTTTKPTFKKWKIPVCYDECFGIDLEEMSLSKNISKKDIIKLHSQVSYTVYFVGFLPGFLYLGGLNELLHCPRKETPRLKVEKGAIAIGGEQTGVYPIESPGGWNIIGNTPLSFFNTSNSSNPCFASAGDKIQFIPISLKEYNNIKILADAGVYQVESEVIDD